MILVHGLSNCDTVRRARAWLGQQGVVYEFHDFGRAGVPEEPLDRWITELGVDALINRRGTTWRRLNPTLRAACDSPQGARACMLAHPALIRRPVVQWQDQSVTTGFDPSVWQERLK
jgi:arsenate reductase